MKQILFIFCFLIASMGIYLYAQEPTHPRKVVILLGPPGSGKGTQAVKLSKELGIPHISTGDILRENVRNSTELGKKAKEYMDKGLLVPDDLILEMLFARVSKPDAARGYLLDGFPRTINQAEALDKHIASGEHIVALNLDVKDEEILKRMAGRLTCRNCSFTHNKFFAPPKKEGVCDKCGGELYQRTDDSEKVVLERLRVYHAQTKPLIQFYDRKNVLYTIDGQQSQDKVFANLLSKV